MMVIESWEDAMFIESADVKKYMFFPPIEGLRLALNERYDFAEETINTFLDTIPDNLALASITFRDIFKTELIRLIPYYINHTLYPDVIQNWTVTDILTEAGYSDWVTDQVVFDELWAWQMYDIINLLRIVNKSDYDGMNYLSSSISSSAIITNYHLNHSWYEYEAHYNSITNSIITPPVPTAIQLKGKNTQYMSKAESGITFAEGTERTVSTSTTVTYSHYDAWGVGSGWKNYYDVSSSRTGFYITIENTSTIKQTFSLYSTGYTRTTQLYDETNDPAVITVDINTDTTLIEIFNLEPGEIKTFDPSCGRWLDQEDIEFTMDWGAVDLEYENSDTYVFNPYLLIAEPNIAGGSFRFENWT